MSDPFTPKPKATRETASISGGQFSAGTLFRLVREIRGSSYKKGEEFMLVEQDDCHSPNILKLGGVGETHFIDPHGKPLRIEAGDRQIDSIFELVSEPAALLEQAILVAKEPEKPVTETQFKELQESILQRVDEIRAIPKGQRGEKGERGDPGGPPGPQGEQGLPGKQGITGKQGKMGPRGPRGLKGERGPQGKRGMRGPSGKDGTRGERGERGESGPKGDKGDKGDSGITSVKFPLVYDKDKKIVGIDEARLDAILKRILSGKTVSAQDMGWFASTGGGGKVAILWNGTALTPDVRSIDFTGVGIQSVTKRGGRITVNMIGGVSALTGGDGIHVSGVTGAITITNTGVTRAVAGTGISVDSSSGTVTITNTGASLGINTFSGLQTSVSGFSGPLFGTASNSFALGGTGANSWALLNSPVFTGVPLAPTATLGTNTTQIATTAFVRSEVTNLVGAAPEALDTLSELADALGDDPNFVTTIVNALGNKAGTTGGGASGTWDISITGNAATATNAGSAFTASNALALGGTGPEHWALLYSPSFGGIPLAPTATVNTNTTQIATTQFVRSQIAADAVTSFNGITGAVTGIESLSAGSGISVSTANAVATVTNIGVLELLAGGNISLSSATGSVTISTSGTNFFYQDTVPVSGVTLGSRWMDSENGQEYIYINDGNSSQWVQPSASNVLAPTINTVIAVSGTSYEASDLDYYIGVSCDSVCTITLPEFPEAGREIIVKDEAGRASSWNRRIVVRGADGDTIDNKGSATINIDGAGLHFIYRMGWRIV